MQPMQLKQKLLMGVATLASLGVVVIATTGAPPKPAEVPQDHGLEVLVVSLAGERPVCSVLDVDPTTGAPTLRPALEQYAQVVVLGVEPGPAPLPVPPTPTPTPGPLNARATAFQLEAIKITTDPKRDLTAQGLAYLYRELGKAVVTGQAGSVTQLEAALKKATDMVLSLNGNATQWQDFRNLQAAQWAAAKQQGVPELGRLLTDMADGLDASAPNRQIDPAFWAFMLELLKIIMALLVKPV